MKVLQVVDSLRIGGAEMLAVTLTAGFLKNGIECTLCGLGNEGNLTSILAERGITGISFSTPLGISPRLMSRMAAHLWRDKTDVVLTHHFRQLFHTALGAVLTGTRIIHVEHDYHFYEKQPSLLPKLEFMLRFADAFVVVSDEIRDWFCKRLPRIADKCIAIPNGVDTKRFKKDPAKRANLRNRYSIDEDATVIGTCARLESIKNLGFLLDAFKGYRELNPGSWLVIVGDGSERQALEKQAHQHGITDRVIFTGASSNTEDYLALFDIYAITSLNEGLPLAVLEAMSSGLPVVGVNVGSLARVITDKTGILIDSHDVGSFIKSFANLSKDKLKADAIGRNGRDLVLEEFSSDTMISRYCKLIHRNCGVIA